MNYRSRPKAAVDLYDLTRDSSGSSRRPQTQNKVININKNRISKITGEAALIFISVFVAIWLESEWQNRADRIEARESFGQLLAELRADQEFAKLVRLEQTEYREKAIDILAWLDSTDPHLNQPDQRVLATFRSVITIWPRRAAWNTMVASGQLVLISDKGLVARIGDFYEHQQTRLVYNGESYDIAHEEFRVHYVPEVWDFRRNKLMTSDYQKISALHGRVRYMKSWADWYLNYLTDYEEALNKLVVDIEEYLAS